MTSCSPPIRLIIRAVDGWIRSIDTPLNVMLIGIDAEKHQVGDEMHSLAGQLPPQPLADLFGHVEPRAVRRGALRDDAADSDRFVLVTIEVQAPGTVTLKNPGQTVVPCCTTCATTQHQTTIPHVGRNESSARWSATPPASSAKNTMASRNCQAAENTRSGDNMSWVATLIAAAAAKAAPHARTWRSLSLRYPHHDAERGDAA